jgi:hypothetical protein
MREPISRRRFLRSSAAGAAAASAAAFGIVPAAAAGRSSTLRMRSIGVASGSALRPSLLAFAGLAGFDELMEKAGARTEFRWTDLPPAAGEATAVVSGFVPGRVTRRGASLVVTGTEDPTAIRMVSVGVGLPGAARDTRPVVVTRHTPAGVPYEDAFLPARERDSGILVASLVDRSGRLLASGPLTVLVA